MAKKRPVCDTCNDTHKMEMHTSSGDVRRVMCTRCPVPCPRCGNGAPYCRSTPCDCDCHKGKSKDGRLPGNPPVSRSMGELLRAYEALKQLNGMLTAVRIALGEAERGDPIGTDLPQSVLLSAYNLSSTLAKLDAYTRAEADRKKRASSSRYPDAIVDGAVGLLRESFRNDGAEGESVHLVCDALIEARAEVSRLREKLGEE